MERIKCITFDKEAQDNLPQHIKDKMKTDREKARKEQKTKAKTLPIQRVSNNEVAVCTHDIWNYDRCPWLKNGRDCNKCQWQTDC